jgi:glycosyltransferase involved in cell wall biosynthesis
MSAITPRLTIAIPTFDRNETLHRTLPALLPQLTEDCRLLIIDNHSATPVEETIAGLLAEVPRDHYSIVRNRFNVGANANIMRCFELCETEWLWVLGDDDVVRPDAVETIIKETSAFPECAFFMFSVEGFYVISQPHLYHGLDEFVHERLLKLSDLESLGFMSTTVSRTVQVQPFLRFGYQFSYTNLAHVALQLLALREGGTCRYVDRPVLDEIVTAQHAESYDYPELLMGRAIIVDLPLPAYARDRLLDLFHSAHWTPMQLALDLLGRIRQGQPQADMLYRYDQLFARLGFRRRSPRFALSRWLFRNLIRFPRLSYWAMASVYYPYVKHRPMPPLSSSGQSEPYERV